MKKKNEVSMFKVFIHSCNKSELVIYQGDCNGGAILANKSDGLSLINLPNSFQCILPDGTVWVVENHTWFQKIDNPLATKNN